MTFINHSNISLKHPDAFVISAGGILFEIEKFEVGAEFRQGFYKGKIQRIESESFTAKYDAGFSITYPLPFEITALKHLNLTDETMYKYGFWKRKRRSEYIQMCLF